MFGEKKTKSPMARQPVEFKFFLDNFRRAYSEQERKPIPNNTEAQRLLAETAVHPYMEFNEAAKRIGGIRIKWPK